MFAEVADKPSSTNGFVLRPRKTLEPAYPGARSPVAHGFPDA
jgi:hypothetical protein